MKMTICTVFVSSSITKSTSCIHLNVEIKIDDNLSNSLFYFNTCVDEQTDQADVFDSKLNELQYSVNKKTYLINMKMKYLP